MCAMASSAGTADPGATGEREVGVGPWPGAGGVAPRPGPRRTARGDPPRPRYDPELLAHGDRRNVVDAYRYWTVEAVVADLDARRDPARRLHVAIENWAHDLNIGSVVRTANAFNAAGVHVVGRRRWNRRGAMVTDRYLHVHHHASVEELAGWAAGRACRSSGSTTSRGRCRSRAACCPRRACCSSARSRPG